MTRRIYQHISRHLAAIAVGFVATGLMTGCAESEIAPYAGTDGIYFDNRLSNGRLSDSTEVTFIYTDATTIDVPVTIRVMGRAATTDRPVALTIGGNATEGTDYALPVAPIVRAGDYGINFVVRLMKTDALSATDKRITLRLAANDAFGTPFTHEGDSTAASPAVSALSYVIRFSNRFSVPPAGWNKDFAGDFTVRKFDFLVGYFKDVPRADYNVAGKITLAMWTYMQTTANDYIAQQVQYRAMGAAYDATAFDEDGNGLYFGN